jgi:hypothetical protein
VLAGDEVRAKFVQALRCLLRAQAHGARCESLKQRLCGKSAEHGQLLRIGERSGSTNTEISMPKVPRIPSIHQIDLHLWPEVYDQAARYSEDFISTGRPKDFRVKYEPRKVRWIIHKTVTL